MTVQKGKIRELKNIGYELFIGALSILSIANLILLYFWRDPSVTAVMETINVIITPIFLFDFFYRFFTTSSKSGYFFRGFGWADLLSSLPFPQVKILRLFRLWRVIRLFVEFGFRGLVAEFVGHRAENALLTVVFLVICVLEFGSMAVLAAERSSPNANITNASDALWWDYVTITTVGYGDHYPVTNLGRLVGIFVMTAGVGLFGTLSGYLANSFLSPSKKKAESEEEPAKTVDSTATAGATTADSTSTAASTGAASTDGTTTALAVDTRAKVAELQAMLDAQEQAAAAIRAKLAEINALL